MPASRKIYNPETVRAAFSRFAVGEESEGEQRMFCPVCEDPETSKSPSASMNAEKGKWNCLKGAHGGEIVALVKDLKEERGFNLRSEAMKGKHSNPKYSEAVQKRLNGDRKAAPLPDAEKIQSWSEKLISNKAALNALMEQRGLEMATIVEWEIGWDGARYTIPVRDEEGELINVRRYKMGGAGPDKMLNLPGHGSAALFRPDILASNEEVVIVEGELDCILLNQYGIPSVTHTAGAATFRPNWASKFVDKIVYIAYDNDDTGHKGAKKVEQILSAFASEIYIMPDLVAKKGGDVTDFLTLEGHTAGDFRGLMEAAVSARGVGGAKSRLPVANVGDEVSLNDSMAQSNQGKTMELVVSIAGKQAEPYTAPRLITATCDQSKGAACTLCPIAARNGQAEVEVRSDDEQLFRFVDVSEQRHRALLREVTGARCSDRVEFEVEENYHIEELLVQPSVDNRKDDETQQPVRRTVFSVGTHSSTVNRKVRLVGKNVPDPRSGKIRFVSWVNDPVEMDIDRFKLDDDLRDRLSIFQPEEDQSPLDKMFEIASDISNNVTHIYGRDILHVAYDIAWHSVISFKVHDMTVEKGWIELAVVGDTRTGKSEVANKLQKHYRSGVMQSCEGMSFAGLVGGVQQIDGRWHMTWGVIPMNDRRLTVLDEMSGLKEKDVIEQMSSIRSSGIAQITKIQSEETSARTRIIWIMNPADGSAIRDNAKVGMGALRTVVPNAEDIARFDFVMATAKGDVASSVINSDFEEQHSPEYSSEDCEALIKWAWSLTRNDVLISDAAAKTVVRLAQEMGERYVPDPPLIQAENVRYKILRIAAAIAARTFSVSARGKLLVNIEHVKDAVRFLDMVYEEDAMGYARSSRRAIASETKAKEKRNLCKNYLMEHKDDVLHTLQIVGGNNFKIRDFEEYGNMSKEAAKAVIQQLTKWQLIFSKSRGDMGMSPTLLSVIRELEEDE